MKDKIINVKISNNMEKSQEKYQPPQEQYTFENVTVQNIQNHLKIINGYNDEQNIMIKAPDYGPIEINVGLVKNALAEAISTVESSGKFEVGKEATKWVEILKKGFEVIAEDAKGYKEEIEAEKSPEEKEAEEAIKRGVDPVLFHGPDGEPGLIITPDEILQAADVIRKMRQEKGK